MAVKPGWANNLKRLRNIGANRNSPSSAYTALKGKVSHGHVLLDVGCGDSNDRLIAHSRGVVAYGVDLLRPLKRSTDRFVRGFSHVRSGVWRKENRMLEVPPKEEQSLVHLVARNPVEVQNAQADLAVWLKNKLIEAKAEVKDFGAALGEAREDGKELVTRYTQPVKFQPEVVFPLRAARSVVMNATAQAMALKVFDQIGICEPIHSQGVTRSGDPLIIGQILGKREGYSQKCVSFIIAWHLDLRRL